MAEEPEETAAAQAAQKSIADLFDGFPYRHFSARQIIYYPGDKIDRIYYIISGYVRMYNITPKGNERTLAIMGPGEAIPLIQAERIIYFYDALTTVEAAYGTYDQIIERFLADKDYMEVARDSGVKLMHRTVEQIEMLAADTAAEKVELALGFLAKYYGDRQDGCTELKFRLTQQELSNLVNLTRETVSAVLNKLEKDGKVKMSDRGRIMLIDQKEIASPGKKSKISLGNPLGSVKLIKKLPSKI